MLKKKIDMNIMVVDDHKILRESLGEYLRINGYHVTYASSAREAYHLYQTKSPDLIAMNTVNTMAFRPS